MPTGSNTQFETNGKITFMYSARLIIVDVKMENICE
jgi:hypothetical protein